VQRRLQPSRQYGRSRWNIASLDRRWWRVCGSRWHDYRRTDCNWGRGAIWREHQRRRDLGRSNRRRAFQRGHKRFSPNRRFNADRRFSPNRRFNADRRLHADRRFNADWRYYADRRLNRWQPDRGKLCHRR
jgi:hypothetical protein